MGGHHSWANPHVTITAVQHHSSGTADLRQPRVFPKGERGGKGGGAPLRVRQGGGKGGKGGPQGGLREDQMQRLETRIQEHVVTGWGLVEGCCVVGRLGTCQVW